MKKVFKVMVSWCLVISISGCKVRAIADIQNEDHDIKTLIIYNDYSLAVENLALMINSKIISDTYNINSNKSLELDDYDLIIVGDLAIDNQITVTMKYFLGNCDFQNKNVALFWIDASDNEVMETGFADEIKNANLLPGIGFNGDEIAETKIVSQFVDGWLTTIY